MDKVFVVKRVAERLWATEDAIDAAMARNAQLMNDVIDARAELKIPHQVVDQAMSKIAEATSLMAQARKAMMESHDALHEAKLRIGVRTKMDGSHGGLFPFISPQDDQSQAAGDRR
jgi:hypothetical protein